MAGAALRRQDWEALGRLLAADEPLLSLSWEEAGIVTRLLDAGYAERLEESKPYRGLKTSMLAPTWGGKTAFVRWVRSEITEGAEGDLVLFRLRRKLKLNAKVEQQLVAYGLLVRRGSLTITPLGHLVATAPPGL